MSHIAFGVDGIAEVAKGLAAQGHTLREPGGTGRRAEGSLTATLDPASAVGFPFHVAEGSSRRRGGAGIGGRGTRRWDGGPLAMTPEARAD